MPGQCCVFQSFDGGRASTWLASILASDDPMRRNPYLRQNRTTFLADIRRFRILKEMTKADIQKQALALPEADQIELAHTLLDNTTPLSDRSAGDGSH